MGADTANSPQVNDHGGKQHNPPYLRPSAKSAVILKSLILLRAELALRHSAGHRRLPLMPNPVY